MLAGNASISLAGSEEQIILFQQSPKMLKIDSENFIHALLMFLGLFLKISRWVPLKPERRRPFGTGLVRHCSQGLFSPFFTIFVPYIFFRRFRLSLVPTICPWVSEDVNSLKPRSSSERERKFCRHSFTMFTSFILPDKLIGHFYVVVGQ